MCLLASGQGHDQQRAAVHQHSLWSLCCFCLTLAGKTAEMQYVTLFEEGYFALCAQLEQGLPTVYR